MSAVKFEIGSFFRRIVAGGLAAAAVSAIGIAVAPTASAAPIKPCTYKAYPTPAHYDKATGTFTPYHVTYVKICPV